MKLELKDIGGRYTSYTSLAIIWDDGTMEQHSDNGEPEDNTFSRDWGWVPGAIERAYADGLALGALGRENKLSRVSKEGCDYYAEALRAGLAPYYEKLNNEEGDI